MSINSIASDSNPLKVADVLNVPKPANDLRDKFDTLVSSGRHDVKKDNFSPFADRISSKEVVKYMLDPLLPEGDNEFNSFESKLSDFLSDDQKQTILDKAGEALGFRAHLTDAQRQAVSAMADTPLNQIVKFLAKLDKARDVELTPEQQEKAMQITDRFLDSSAITAYFHDGGKSYIAKMTKGERVINLVENGVENYLLDLNKLIFKNN